MSEQAPKTIWETILGRASSGFYVEASRHPYFLNDAYLQKLCDVENTLAGRYGKLVQIGFLLSLFSLAAAYGILGDFEFKGFTLAKVPFLLEFCILVLGVVVMMQVVIYLDILTIGGMRRQLFSTTNSEDPNMRMVHMKGDGAWLDAIIPKSVGYSSGIVHKLIAFVSLIWVLFLPVAFFSVVIAAQVICFFAVNRADHILLSGVISYSGLVFSGLSIFILLATMLLPLPFHIREQPQSDLPDDMFNKPDPVEFSR